MRPRRSVYEIIWDILRYCRTPRKLSHILLMCNLSTRTAKKYIDLLVSKGLLAKHGEEYVTTNRGAEYIEAFSDLYRRVFGD